MRKKLRACIQDLKRNHLDSLLISNPTNIKYFTNFREADGYLLLTQDEKMIYFTSPLYKDEAKKLKLWEVVGSNGNIFDLIKDKIVHLNLKNVGFEAKNLPFLEYEKIKNSLSMEGVDLIKTIDLVENLRSIKSDEEIALIKKSIRVSLEALDFAQEIYNEELSEKDLSIEIERFLKLKGDNELAFSPIVASGKNSAFAHHLPGEEKLNKKFFLIDLGSKYYGYCADLTRVFFWSKMPILFKKLYDIVTKAHDLSINKIKDGVRAKEVDKAARDFIDKKGFAKYFIHGVGHGIGLSVHETPFLSPKSEEVLKSGMVVTIEPAIYLEGKFGLRLENMVLVKENKGEILSGNTNR